MKKKKKKRTKTSLTDLQKDFNLLKNAVTGRERVLENLKEEEADSEKYLATWYKMSQEAEFVYPSQGLLTTPYDYLNYQSRQMLPMESVKSTLRLRRFFLEIYNHPYRILALDEINNKPFIKVPKISGKVIESAVEHGLALSIRDLAASVSGSSKERISRNTRFANGPFVKLGRQARSFFVGSSSPDVWNSSEAVSTMAACHCLAAIPRNGLLADIKRQADLATEVFLKLDLLAKNLLKNRPDRLKILNIWKKNIMGTLPSDPDEALTRTEILYRAGVGSFRIYSPEPGTGPLRTVLALRKNFSDKIEIFAGQVVDVDQARAVEEAGADGIFVGIGGGGRCITGVRSGSVIDWPELVWNLRGQIGIPVIVEGGASDHVAVTLLLGASGISVSRIVAGGTIESPGGLLYFSDSKGKLFKPYGGEASARTKYVESKILPFDIPSFVEGETTKAEMSYIKHALPTLTYNLYMLNEDAILALVFRGVSDLYELHALNPSPLRQITSSGEYQRNSH